MACSGCKALSAVMSTVFASTAAYRVFESPNCFQCLKGDILFEILIVNGAAGVLCREVNQGADFHRIQIHVTVLLDVRLYLT